MRSMYRFWYRFGDPPWIGEARSELVELVESGRLPPGRAIDLGCGVGDNAVFLAEHGFKVTGVDFAGPAIERARARAAEAGVTVDFLVDDLTDLQQVRGTFDLLVDYGTLDDLGQRGRAKYAENVIPLTRPGSLWLLWCFEWELLWWERLLTSVLPFGDMALAPGEVEERFGHWFAIERFAGERKTDGWPRGWAAYLLTRTEAPYEVGSSQTQVRGQT